MDPQATLNLLIDAIEAHAHDPSDTNYRDEIRDSASDLHGWIMARGFTPTLDAKQWLTLLELLKSY